MPKKSADAKLRALIRKVVKEELNKVLNSNDPRYVSVPSDNFDLDPRFSTGHYTTENEPVPFDQRSGVKRQSKRRTSKKASGNQTNPVEPHLGGVFGPMPPLHEQPPLEQRGAGNWPPQGEHLPPFPPPHPGMSGIPHHRKQNQRDDD